jgi:hypothetical protein
MVRHGRIGETGQDMERRGEAGHSTAGKDWLGPERSGMVRRGIARQAREMEYA